MVAGTEAKTAPPVRTSPARHGREFLRRTVFRLFLTYLFPLIVLTVYFHIQWSKLVRESWCKHLQSLAEYQANTLDLFFRERVVNLSNLINDPKLEPPPTPGVMQRYLDELKRNSDAFVDVGFFDSSGIQAAYAGPFKSLERQDYSHEKWFVSLQDEKDRYIITDIYLGFRQKPHFTIGVSRVIGGQYVVMRATLDPQKIYEYITGLGRGAGEVYSAIVNPDGYYQVVTADMGSPLGASSFVPPKTPRLGVGRVKLGGKWCSYGYSWLQMADWALIVQRAGRDQPTLLGALDVRTALLSLALILGGLVVIIYRGVRVARQREESEMTQLQLEHAAKLATVGELAGGIAHEINNPLAIISEEAGLVKDLMNPEYGGKITYEEIAGHLDVVQEAVFRARDITRNLLDFVRKSELALERQDIHEVIHEVVDGFITREMAVEDIAIKREFGADIPEITTNKNQLKQVLLNIIKNARDAILPPGTITISTTRDERNVYIAVTDTGIGITREQLGKIFLPFYTTKDVGKGTGLGLSVSYGMVKSLGGTILVDSVPKRGSTFTVVLPVK